MPILERVLVAIHHKQLWSRSKQSIFRVTSVCQEGADAGWASELDQGHSNDWAVA